MKSLVKNSGRPWDVTICMCDCASICRFARCRNSTPNTRRNGTTEQFSRMLSPPQTGQSVADRGCQMGIGGIQPMPQRLRRPRTVIRCCSRSRSFAVYSRVPAFQSRAWSISMRARRLILRGDFGDGMARWSLRFDSQRWFVSDRCPAPL